MPKITLNLSGQTIGVALELLICTTEDMITWILEYFITLIQKLLVFGAMYQKLKFAFSYVKILLKNNANVFVFIIPSSRY